LGSRNIHKMGKRELTTRDSELVVVGLMATIKDAAELCKSAISEGDIQGAFSAAIKVRDAKKEIELYNAEGFPISADQLRDSDLYVQCLREINTMRAANWIGIVEEAER
jgi:hypothetical protein